MTKAWRTLERILLSRRLTPTVCGYGWQRRDRELIVVDPFGDEVHLTYNRVASGREFANLISEAKFMSLRRLTLKVDRLQGFNFYDFKVGPVFKANGRYRFVLTLLDKYGYLDLVPLCSVIYQDPRDLRRPPKPRQTYFGNDPY